MGAAQSTTISHCEAPAALPAPPSDFGELPPEAPESSVPALVQQSVDQELEKARLKNPGLYEHIQNDVKRVLSVDVFDGFRFEMHKPLGHKLSISHTLWLGSQMIPDGFYQFGVNSVVGDDLTDPATILLGRMTPDGRLDARWHQKVSDQLSLRLQSQLAPEPNPTQVTCDVDFRGQDCTGNLKYTNGPLFGVSYLQAVTNQLSLGGEGYYHHAHQKSILSYCGRYQTEDSTSLLTYGSVGTLQLHYMRRLSDRVRLASEFFYNSNSGESKAQAGAEFTLRQSRFVTNVDESGKIMSSLETKVTPMVTFLLSAEALHSKGDFKFGYGLQFGQ